MLAYQFIARDQAGLVLAGRDDDGDYLFMGTSEQREDAHVREMQYWDTEAWPEPPRTTEVFNPTV